MSNSLTQFDFHGDALAVTITNSGEVFVSIRRVCDALGVDFSGQLQRLKSAVWAVVEFISTTGEDGKRYTMAMIELEALPMWLANIKKVRPGLQSKLELYQCEAKKALADRFLRPPVQTSTPQLSAPEETAIRRYYAAKVISDAVMAGSISKAYGENYAIHTAAIISGDAPQIETRLQDVSSYLEERGFTTRQVKSECIRFGQRVKALYVAKTGRAPDKQPRMVNGADRDVNSYTEHDRPLFDQAFADLYGKAAITTVRGKQRYSRLR